MEAYMTRSAQSRPDSEVTANIWHQRLGHIHKDIVKKLPEAITRVKLTKDSTLINYEICRISKATQKISHHPVPQVKKPYECIHLDLIQMTRAYNRDR